jgi:hypothetical protein
VQPDPACALLAARLKALTSASTVQVSSCSAELLDVRFETTAGTDSDSRTGPSEDLARRVWEAADRRAAYVDVTLELSSDFGVMQCYGTRPWRRNPGCRIPDSLPAEARANIRVRLWDERTRRFIRTAFSLEKPDGWSESAFFTGVGSDGWGETFWLPPGRYAIAITELPCGREHYFLKHTLTKAFVARAGAAVDLTLRVHSGSVSMMKSHNNPGGHSCTDGTGPDIG